MRLLLALCAALFACEGSQKGAAERVVVIDKQVVAQRLLLTGALDAIASNDLTVPATPAFRLKIQWLVEDGADVKKGDKVLAFDNTQLVSNLAEKELAVLRAANDMARQVAQNRVTLADKSFALLQNRINRDKARLNAAIPEDTLAKRTYQEFQLGLTKSESAYEQAKEDLATQKRSAALDRQIKQLALEKAERDYQDTLDALKKLELVAPQDGIAVISDNPWEGRKFQVGDDVWPGLAVVRFPDLRAMLVKASLADVDDGRVEVGAAVRCRLDAYPDRELSGVVRAISPVAQEISSESLRRTFDVIIDLDETDAEIMRPGMSVLVEIRKAAGDPTVVAPREAITFGPETSKVRREGGAEVVVELGACGSQLCEIKAGLSEGDRIVLGGTP